MGQGHESRSLRPRLTDVLGLVTGSTSNRSPNHHGTRPWPLPSAARAFDAGARRPGAVGPEALRRPPSATARGCSATPVRDEAASRLTVPTRMRTWCRSTERSRSDSNRGTYSLLAKHVTRPERSGTGRHDTGRRSTNKLGSCRCRPLFHLVARRPTAWRRPCPPFFPSASSVLEPSRRRGPGRGPRSRSGWMRSAADPPWTGVPEAYDRPGGGRGDVP
jgi:hypothetical protein